MKQPIAWFLVCSASLALGSAAVGCGGDDSSTGTSAGGSGGTGGTGGAGGKGGTAGTSGSAGTGGGGTAGTGGAAGTGGGTADSGTDAGGITMICGNKTCTEIDIGFGTPFPPCCPQGEMNACGVSLMGICLTTTPGTSDARCPAVTIPMSPMPAPGCCAVTGFCGADLGSPLGCNDLSGILGGTPIPCGPDAGPPPPPPEAGADVTPPPPDTGTGTDSGGTDTGGSDSGSGDASEGGPAEGGPTDASSDRSG